MEREKVKRTVGRMTEARAVILRENPFFGHLAMALQLACASCGTACTDGSRLFFDPEFAEQLSDRELQFIMLHEVLHCVLNHCGRGRNLDAFRYNIACDIVVNSTILSMWGMTKIRIAGEEAMHLAPDGKEGHLYSAEEIYRMLADKGGCGRQTTGTASGAGNEERDRAENSAGANDPAEEGEKGTDRDGFDRHDLWQGIIDKARIRDVWNHRIREAARDCGGSLQIPQNMRRVVDDLVKKAGLNWKQLLHDFIQYDLYDYSFLPPDRRYSSSDFFLPAFNVDEDNGSAAGLWVCVDTSGSISDEELSGAMAEISDAMRQAGLRGTISFFDCEITEPVPFGTEEDVKKIIPTGGGGTSFRVIFRYMREHLAEQLPRAVLIFTDGYAPWPEEREAMEVPVLWLISKGGRKDVPWGRVAEM